MRKILLVVWLIVGVLYAASTMTAEFLYAHGVKVAKTSGVKSLSWFNLAATLAPEVHWIRQSTSYLGTVDADMPDEQAILLMQAELKYDPYDTTLWLFIALRQLHSGKMDDAKATLARIKQLWPGSPLDRMLTDLTK